MRVGSQPPSGLGPRPHCYPACFCFFFRFGSPAPSTTFFPKPARRWSDRAASFARRAARACRGADHLGEKKTATALSPLPEGSSRWVAGTTFQRRSPPGLVLAGRGGGWLQEEALRRLGVRGVVRRDLPRRRGGACFFFSLFLRRFRPFLPRPLFAIACATCRSAAHRTPRRASGLELACCFRCFVLGLLIVELASASDRRAGRLRLLRARSAHLRPQLRRAPERSRRIHLFRVRRRRHY